MAHIATVVVVIMEINVTQVELNTATLPPQQPLPTVGEKLHQVFHNVLENLFKVMDGYCLEEPYFSSKVPNRTQGPQRITPCVACFIGSTMAC